MLGGIGPTELIIILFIILVIFGAGRLPDIASGLGKGLRDFKKVMQEPDEPVQTEPPEERSEESPSEDDKREEA
jgi:sec-independent protein translocase protein TatA